MKNKTLIQFFEWYLPDNGLLWKKAAAQAEALEKAGITMIWLPPAYKGSSGIHSVGYDVYDMYDLGEFDQKGSVSTKYGTRGELLDAVGALQSNGISVLCDVVFNHRMGADATEEVVVEEKFGNDRNRNVGGTQTISAWTKFDFPGRGDKYSSFHWNATHFSGADWDERNHRNGIFQFAGKNWNLETDDENGNYDYLMGADLDTDNPEVINETENWGKWFLDTVKPDGFRLDAVKHIGFDFYRRWIESMRAHAGKNGQDDFFIVGEYWSREVGKLKHYLDVTQRELALFDVPLHFHFYQAATSNGNFDMRTLFDGTLVAEEPANAVTFVDNHDTQPGQALQSFIPDWFKPIAYAIILLRDAGVPCVFYGDYYGIPHDNIPSVPGLNTLLRIRKDYAYGTEHLYFDDPSVVGFTREGDNGQEHKDSGVAVLLSDSVGGSKRMYVGTAHAGQEMFDAMGKIRESVFIDDSGCGEFSVSGGSVSVWVSKNAYERLFTE